VVSLPQRLTQAPFWELLAHRAVSDCSLRSLRCSLVAAVFVGAYGTERRCSAISSCRSAARTSRIRRRRRRSQRKDASAPSISIARCRSLGPALVSRCLPPSLADERRVCSLARPGQRRASLAPCDGARLPTLATRNAGDYPVRRADSSAGVTNRYPTLRTVPMTDSYSGPSLARSRRTWTSTVRVPP
jgi:hypothetical protein